MTEVLFLTSHKLVPRAPKFANESEEKVTSAKDRKVIDNNNVEAMLTCKTS